MRELHARDSALSGVCNLEYCYLIDTPKAIIMKYMQRFLTVIRRGWWGAILVVVLEMPVLVYRGIFGSELSKDHTHWSEMGSAMSGIYGPILTALTLFVLIRQVQLQDQTNKHTFDQSYLQNAKADIDFYLSQLIKALEKNEDVPVRNILRSFEFAKVQQLSENQLMQSALAVNSSVPELQAIWAAIYSIYAGLSANDESQYRLHFTSARQKTIVMLSYGTCVGLDHYLSCLTAGRLNYKYLFSPELSAQSES